MSPTTRHTVPPRCAKPAMVWSYSSQPRRAQQVVPVVVSRDVAAGDAAEQLHPLVAGVVDVGSQLDEALAGPPQHHGGGERVVLLQKRDQEDERNQHLQQRAAERRHEVAEHAQDDVPGLVEHQVRHAEDVIDDRHPGLRAIDLQIDEEPAIVGEEDPKDGTDAEVGNTLGCGRFQRRRAKIGEESFSWCVGVAMLIAVRPTRREIVAARPSAQPISRGDGWSWPRMVLGT